MVRISSGREVSELRRARLRSSLLFFALLPRFFRLSILCFWKPFSSLPQGYTYPSQIYYPNHQAQTQQQLQHIYYQSSHHQHQQQLQQQQPSFSPPLTPSHYQQAYPSSSTTHYAPPPTLPSFNSTFGYGGGGETRSEGGGDASSSSSSSGRQRGTSWAWGLRPVGEEWREEEGRD